MSGKAGGERGLRLGRCDLAECEGACCYDGAYLEPGEEEAILAAIARDPALFSFLDGPPVVDGTWRGIVAGRKTGVRPHRYRSPEFPAHFEQTRCVLALPDARCALQVHAVARGMHPFALKPRACWMHPLHDGPSGPVPPPADPAADPHRVDADYPGYVTFTECGRHRDGGLPWREALAEELKYARILAKRAATAEWRRARAEGDEG